jgi:hypothetical protein
MFFYGAEKNSGSAFIDLYLLPPEWARFFWGDISKLVNKCESVSPGSGYSLLLRLRTRWQLPRHRDGWHTVLAPSIEEYLGEGSSHAAA